MSIICYPAALADSSLINFPLYDRILSPTTMGYTGATLSPPSHSAVYVEVSAAIATTAVIQELGGTLYFRT